MASDKLFRLNLNDRAIPEFVSMMLGSIPLRCQIVQSINGAEGLANNVSQAAIKGLKITLPAVEEQQEISRYIKNRCYQLERLLETAITAIDLLKERRSAMISAAVTGKIDVRNWKPSSKNAETLFEKLESQGATA